MCKHIRISIRDTVFDVLPVVADSVVRRFSGDLHFHNHMELWYVRKGEMKHIIGNREYLQTPGSLALVRAYTPHMTDTSGSEETPVIFSAVASEKGLRLRGYDCFLCNRENAAFNGRRLPEFIELSGAMRTEAESVIRRLLDEDLRKHPESPDVRCRLFAELLDIVSRNMPRFKVPRALRERTDAINAAVNYISEHYTEKIPLDKLCEDAIMSKRRFTENFKTITGTTAGNIIFLMRMFKAEQLLIFSDATLDELARSLGFYDKSSFSHAFFRCYGMTPGEYRGKNRGEAYKSELEEQLKRRHRYDTLNYYYSLKHNGEPLDKSMVTHMQNLI